MRISKNLLRSITLSALTLSTIVSTGVRAEVTYDSFVSPVPVENYSTQYYENDRGVSKVTKSVHSKICLP